MAKYNKYHKVKFNKVALISLIILVAVIIGLVFALRTPESSRIATDYEISDSDHIIDEIKVKNLEKVSNDNNFLLVITNKDITDASTILSYFNEYIKTKNLTYKDQTNMQIKKIYLIDSSDLDDDDVDKIEKILDKEIDLTINNAFFKDDNQYLKMNEEKYRRFLNNVYTELEENK